MAKQTSINLRKSVIYSIFVRNFTEEGTFKAVVSELDRIKDLGTYIVWFLPMYPIGEESRKGKMAHHMRLKITAVSTQITVLWRTLKN